MKAPPSVHARLRLITDATLDENPDGVPVCSRGAFQSSEKPRAPDTAGDHERSFVKDGTRYHHILDPRTGYPATASRSVTVWAADALTADAIDDGIFILGPEKGIPICDAIDDCGAVVVDADDKVWVSRRVVGVFQQNRAPTDGR